MSEALDYLLKTRPEAMQSYFAFLKQSGKHLDPKTRAIISVITKVDKQTEGGFKQYLKRALKEGVTANEIIDALLVAFPTLGLSKIIWATNLLLEMDLPEFRPENLAREASWHEVVDLEDLKDGVHHMNINGKDIFVVSGNGDTKIYDSLCPHQSTLIPVDAINGTKLVCPKHNWKFDLATGACIEKGDKPLTLIKTMIKNNSLYAFI